MSRLSSHDWEVDGPGAGSQLRSKSLYPPAVTNPFAQQTHISAWRWASLLLLGTVLVPARVSCMAVLFVFLWPVTMLSTMGHAALRGEPAGGWRRKLLLRPLRFLFQTCFLVLGFLVKVKGKKASQSEAPIFVTAPHSTFFDAIACVVAGLPSVVSETAEPGEQSKSLNTPEQS